MSDFQRLLKKKPCPNMSDAKKAERGEGGEKIRDALKAGKGDIVAGTKKLGLKKEGLSEQLKKAKTKKGK